MPCTYQDSQVQMMNGAQPLNKGEMLPDQVQMALSGETRLFLSTICFKFEVMLLQELFFFTSSYGVLAVANSSNFTVTTSRHFFGSLITFPRCWHDRDVLMHPYLTILCQQLFSPHHAIIPGSSSTILRWIVQTALTAVAGQRHTLQCVVLTGSPTLEATTTVNAEANSIVNPLREA